MRLLFLAIVSTMICGCGSTPPIPQSMPKPVVLPPPVECVTACPPLPQRSPSDTNFPAFLERDRAAVRDCYLLHNTCVKRLTTKEY